MTKARGKRIPQTNSDYITQTKNFNNAVDASVHDCTHAYRNTNKIYYHTEGEYLWWNTTFFVCILYAYHKS